METHRDVQMTSARPKRVNTLFSLNEKVNAEIDDLASEMGESRSTIVRLAVSEFKTRRNQEAAA